MKKAGREKVALKDVIRRKRENFLAEKLPDLELSSQQQFMNMLPAFMQERIARLPGGLFDLSEDELAQRLFAGETPLQTHQLLRQAFWDEYDRCHRHKIAMMDTYRIIHGVCSLGYFSNRFLASDLNVAWLIVAPVDYMKAMKEILQMGTAQFREIMAMPNANEDGKPNVKLMEVKFKIVQHVDMRVKGAIIQRIDQRTVNVNLDGESEAGLAATADIARPVGELSMSEVDAKLKALEQRSLALSAPARVEIDLMKTPTVLLDADEETQGIQKPDVARHGNLPE